MQPFPPSAQPATGYLEEVTWRAGRLSLAGWMVDPGTPLERVVVHVDGRELGVAARFVRRDVRRFLGWIPHAGDSGFSFQTPWDSPTGRVDLLGEFHGRVVSRLSSFFTSGAGVDEPTPPAEVSERATLLSGAFLKLQGLRIFTDLYDQIERFVPRREALELLDWGCGSGRTTAHFIAILKARVFGADIDSEAVDWCRRHLIGGDFRIVGVEPPLPYPDHSFDVAVACSVFTHLSRKNQEDWLAELSRVLRPGGILLATTHGDFAYRQALHRRGRSWKGRLLGAFARRGLAGFADHGPDGAFDGIAPPGYYRNVYQSRQYTIEKWTGWFELLDYIERGVDGFQDLVAMRARESQAPSNRLLEGR